MEGYIKQVKIHVLTYKRKAGVLGKEYIREDFCLVIRGFVIDDCKIFIDVLLVAKINEFEDGNTINIKS